MAILRHIGLLLLILAILPWGAYAGVRLAGPYPVIPHVHAEQGPVALPVPPEVTVAQAKRPCRIGVLSVGCGWDGRLDAVMAGDIPAVHDAGHVTEAPDLRAGLVPGPPKDPPRAA